MGVFANAQTCCIINAEQTASPDQDVCELLSEKILLLNDDQLDELIKVVEYELSKNNG